LLDFRAGDGLRWRFITRPEPPSMTSLHSVLAALAERPDVAGAAVVSDEGLVIAASLPGGVEGDAVAALTVSAQRALGALAATVRHQPPDETVISSADGILALVRLGSATTLLVVAAAGADVGALLYDLRRHAPVLVALA
jgi:predicted regulator of Ras-like GTPase activity (Roadblock/LC7/MglB family)